MLGRRSASELSPLALRYNLYVMQVTRLGGFHANPIPFGSALQFLAPSPGLHEAPLGFSGAWVPGLEDTRSLDRCPSQAEAPGPTQPATQAGFLSTAE